MKTMSFIIKFLIFLPVICISGDFGSKILTADIDHDGRNETIQWKKFKSNNLGSYYQLFVIDDNGRLLWEGSKDSRNNNPFVFVSLHTGKSFPELLFDVNKDGYIELLAPEPQSDVSPTYYRQLKWTGRTFEYLYSRPLIMKEPGSGYFTWAKGQHSYGIWVSKFKSVGKRGLVEAAITYYDRDGTWGSGIALLRFTSTGAVVHRWIKPIPQISGKKTPVAKKSIIGIVYGLDPNGDGFLSIRKKPRSTEIGRLYNGDRVEILDQKGKWYKIRDIRSKKVGWSHSNWIKIDNSVDEDRHIPNVPKGEVLSNLNFTVAVNYSSRALKKLQKSNEKVKVWVIIDQYGKQYMEEEAIADGEITINPGEKAVFRGIPLTESNYQYKKNKRYMATIMVVSAQQKYKNNILWCHSKSGTTYNIHNIQGKEIEFTCKLIR